MTVFQAGACVGPLAAVSFYISIPRNIGPDHNLDSETVQQADTSAKLKGMLLRILLFAALALPLSAAPPPMTTLTIHVTSQSGKPVENASVIVKFVKGHSVAKLGKKIRKEWELRTNPQGKVSIPPIPQGKILIQVIAENYQTFGQTFDITEDNKTVDIALNPPQPQYTAHP